MEAPIPIFQINQDIQKDQDSKINFIEEILVKKENREYKIQFEINESYAQNEIIIKVINNNLNEYFCYQNKYNQKDFQNFSKIFSMYENLKEIISFLKSLKYEIEEKNDSSLILKFNIFLPNGKNQLIELNLKKNLLDSNNMIYYLLEENKLLKEEIEKNKKEINLLKQNISKNENEISLLRENNIKNNKEISLLWSEISNLKEINKNNNDYMVVNNEYKIVNGSFDSKIIKSINELDFIFNYIKENDKTFSFNNLNLLYRGSRDGDRTSTCHKLCDNKQNVLIIIKSSKGKIFGGYCKIGFKVSSKNEYKIDNNCFLFSYDLKKIYPVIENKEAICYIGIEFGLCFSGSLVFYDNFMNNKNSNICGGTLCFKGLTTNYEMNGGKKNFKCQDLEVFQLK